MLYKNKIKFEKDDCKENSKDAILKKMEENLKKINANVITEGDVIFFERAPYHSNLGNINRLSSWILKKGKLEVSIEENITITFEVILNNLIFMSIFSSIFIIPLLLYFYDLQVYTIIIVAFICFLLISVTGYLINKWEIHKLIRESMANCSGAKKIN